MTTYVPPRKNTEYIIYVGLPSQVNSAIFQANPTLAAGDFKVSIDGGALNNLGTLPTVTPASGKMVKILLSNTEMNGDNITVVCSDASGDEWGDVIINIQTSAQQIDDLSTQTSVNTIDDFLDTEIASLTTNLSNANTNINAIKAATDVLITAQAEPTGAPAASETPLDKLAYLFAALRNKLTVTASAKTFHDDAGVAMWSKSLSDDATTYTENEGS